MIKEALFLQTTPFFEGGFGQVLGFLEEAGFFSYIIPFLLIFALVFGILQKVNLFKNNKAINAIIALAVGLMSLQFGFVSTFFAEIFPRLGVGLVIVLVILIIVGLFIDPGKSGINVALFVIAAIIVIVVVVQSAGALGWVPGAFWQQNLGNIIGAVLILGIIIGVVAAIVNAGKPKGNKTPFTFTPVMDNNN